jgi:transposase
MLTQYTQRDFTGQDVFVGLDVHKRSWQVAIMVGDTFHKSFHQPPKTEVLVNYLRRNFPGGHYHCVYEAGYCGFWIHQELQSHGVDCSVTNPADVPTSDKEKRNKTNPVDARKLVRSLRNRELHPIYIPSRQAQEDRSLVRTRYGLVSKQSRCKNQIKALLCFYGISVPEDISERYWSRRYLTWLESLKLQSKSGTDALQTLLNELEHYRRSILSITRAIRQLAKQERYTLHVKNLVSIPGISTLTAMIFLTELIALDRFCSLDALAAYVGLVPGEDSSGDGRTITNITPRKNPYLRWILIEAAWVAVREDAALMLAFNQLSHRMPKNRAIIRIARKLLNRVRFVLKNGKPYVRVIGDQQTATVVEETRQSLLVVPARAKNVRAFPTRRQ